MKRIFSCIISLLLLSAVFSGCRNKDSGPSEPLSEQSRSQSKNQKKNQNNNQKTSVTDAKDSGTSKPAYFADSYRGTNAPGGYYRIKQETGDEETPCRITYVDFASKQEVYLCNQAQCHHKDDSCTAVISSGEMPGGQYQLIFYNASLYLFSSVSVLDQEQGEGLLAASGRETTIIYKINADGSGRTKITEIPNMTVDGGGIVAVDGSLFVSAYRDNPDAGAVDKIIAKVNIKEKSHEILPSLGSVYGVCGNDIILSELVMPDLSGKSEDQTLDALKNIPNTVYRYNPVTGDKQKIAEMISDDMMYTVVSGERLICLGGNDKIHYVDLKTGKKGELAAVEERSSISGAVDGKLIVAQGKSNSAVIVDCVTGDIAPFKLLTKSAKEPRPVEIYGADSEFYYVCSDVIEEEEYVPWMDKYQNVIRGEVYSLISKADFWAQKANFLKLKSSL